MDDRIDRIQRISARREGVLGLAGGLPADELFPRQELAEAFVSVIGRDTSGALQYGWPEGSEGLRRFIAERLRARGAEVTEEEVIVTNGAQQALALATELVGVADRTVVTDRETYPGALDVFRARGAATREAPHGDVAFHYLVPGASNPRGIDLAPERRRALLTSQDMLLVDEAYAELRFDGRLDRPLLADARDRVLHIGTFSKTLCPGLRVGWLVVPPDRMKEALHRKHETDLQAGSLAQAVLEEYLARNELDDLLERARALYEIRTMRLLSAIKKWLPNARFVEPEGGFAVFVDTDLEGIDEARALAIATKHGTGFDPGSMFRASGAVDPFGMRLSSSRLDGVELDEAVQRLARAFDEIRAGASGARPIACSTVTRSRRGSARSRPSSISAAATNSKRARSRVVRGRSKPRVSPSASSSKKSGSRLSPASGSRSRVKSKSSTRQVARSSSSR